MARLYPEDFDLSEGEIFQKGEHQTLLKLKEGLSDQYLVFHGVHWTRIQDTAAIYGEIDFLIMNPYGRVLAIEQKETQIEVNNNGQLVPLYRNTTNSNKHTKTINTQVSRNIGALRSEYGKRYPGQHLYIDHLLYVPNACVDKQLPSNIALGRIVDSSNKEDLISIIIDLFENYSVRFGDDYANVVDIQNFFHEKARITPQIGLIGKLAKQRTTRLSSGLSDWSQRLDFSPFRLWVTGTAGSGKTQLALSELQKSDIAGQTALYVCFNRPLADSMKSCAPNPKCCMTFHELARFVAESSGTKILFSEESTYQWLIDNFLKNYHDLENQLDVLIVDEGQDFYPEWHEILIKLVKPQGRVIWLEDPSQKIYERSNIQTTGWVKLTSPTNYRSPKHVLTLINGLNLADTVLDSGTSYIGLPPGHFVYADGAELDATVEALQDLLDQGFTADSIVILSFRGAKNSKLFSNELRKIGDLLIKRPTGYDENGLATWSDGEILVDTLYRFKGQCADAVIVTEIDFSNWDELSKNKLFVGLTRARLTVNLVMSEKVEQLFIDRGFS